MAKPSLSFNCGKKLGRIAVLPEVEHCNDVFEILYDNNSPNGNQMKMPSELTFHTK